MTPDCYAEVERVNKYWRAEVARLRTARDHTPEDARLELVALHAEVDRLDNDKKHLIKQLLHASRAWAALRAQVEAMPGVDGDAVVRRGAVLELIDGIGR